MLLLFCVGNLIHTSFLNLKCERCYNEVQRSSRAQLGWTPILEKDVREISVEKISRFFTRVEDRIDSKFHRIGGSTYVLLFYPFLMHEIRHTFCNLIPSPWKRIVNQAGIKAVVLSHHLKDPLEDVEMKYKCKCGGAHTDITAVKIN